MYFDLHRSLDFNGNWEASLDWGARLLADLNVFRNYILQFIDMVILQAFEEADLEEHWNDGEFLQLYALKKV